ncbi:hypothetical protein BDP67DRAFT_488015 [Colletotrichum lupini]|nr:hypothetical protein BDP67DRAFT_488015 [Colletotrichum lupini]
MTFAPALILILASVNCFPVTPPEPRVSFLCCSRASPLTKVTDYLMGYTKTVTWRRESSHHCHESILKNETHKRKSFCVHWKEGVYDYGYHSLTGETSSQG